MLMVIPAIACVVICIYILGKHAHGSEKKCVCFGQSSFWEKKHAHPSINFQCLLLQPYFSCMCFPLHDAHDPFDHEDCCGILKLLTGMIPS